MRKRILRVKGFYNLRDIGGYSAFNGYSTKWARLLRADNPKKISWFGHRKLKRYGVNLVIDVREPHELDLTPDPLSSYFDHEHLPLINDKQRYDSYSDLTDIYLMYLDFIEQSKSQIRKIIQRIIENPDACTILHCAAGKDRTGLIAALILGHCHVDDELIIKDYAMSTSLLERRFRKQKKINKDDVKYNIIFVSHPLVMKRLIDYLWKEYHGASGYLRAIGLTNKELLDLKNIFTTT